MFKEDIIDAAVTDEDLRHAVPVTRTVRSQEIVVARHVNNKKKNSSVEVSFVMVANTSVLPSAITRWTIPTLDPESF